MKDKAKNEVKLMDQIKRFTPLLLAMAVMIIVFKDMVLILFAVVVFFLGALYGTMTKNIVDKIRMRSEGEKILAKIDEKKKEGEGK